ADVEAPNGLGGIERQRHVRDVRPHHARPGDMAGFGDQIRRNLVRSDNAAAVFLDDLYDVAENRIVSTDHRLDQSRHQFERTKIDPHARKVGSTIDRSDQHDLPGTMLRDQREYAANLAPLYALVRECGQSRIELAIKRHDEDTAAGSGRR